MAKQLLGNLKELFSPFFALKDHAHGLITKDGTISGQASKNVVTDSNGKITTEAKPTIPSANATATNIKMNGTQSAGSLTTFAKADHVHPVDTSRAAAVHTHDDRYYTETEVNTKLSDYLTTDDASATYQPKGSYLTSHNPVDTALSSTSTNAVQNKVINTALSGKANSSHTHTKSQITDFPTIPTKTSQLTNDSGYLTEHQSLTNYVQTNDSRLSDTRNPKSNKITASSSSIQDLNTYITTGFYYSPLNTEAQYIIHCPNSNGTATPYSANKAFFLLVEDWGSNNYTKQTLTYYDTNKTYTRIRNGGTWGNWTELTKDTNTTYSADNSTLQLSSTTFSVKDGGITNAKLADKSSLITEYIVGTQASSTSAWTGKATKITSLAAGQVIYYKLPYSSTSTYVTLNLTLADGSTTGAKEVWFWNGGRMTTQYGVNSVIGLIYNGTQWWAINPSNNNNNDYLRLATRIVNGDTNQIPANRIIGGVSDSNGVGKYYIVTSGKVLDVRYPILFNNSAINSGSYTDNVYISHTGVPLVNNVSGKTVTSQRQVYIEGTAYSNNKLTVSSNVFVSDDNLTNGYYYLYIGVSYSTTHIRFNAMNQIVYKKTSNGLIPVGQSYNDLTDKPSTFPPSSHTHDDRYFTETEINTKLNDYIQKSNSTDLLLANGSTKLQSSFATSGHGHGKVTSGGTLSETTTSVKNVVVTDTTNNNLRVINKVPFANLDIDKEDIVGLGIPSSDTNTTYTAESTSSNIKMNGTQATGSLSTYARGDHVHPSDTSRVAVSQGTGNSGKFLKVNSSGNVACESVTIPSAYTHPNSGVTAGTNYNGNQTPSFGGTFNIPKLTFNAQGHITASANSTVKIPALPTSSTSQAGIIQIGTGASNAAAGNHSHYAGDIDFNANSDAWQQLGTPTDVNSAINGAFDYFEENKANTNHTHTEKILIAKVFSDTTSSIAADTATNRTFNVPELPDGYNWVFIPTKCNYGYISNSELNTDTNILTVRVVNHASSSHGITYAGILVYYHNSLKL